MLRHHLPVDGDSDFVVPRDDVHGVPVVVVLPILRGIHKPVDAAGRVGVGVAVVDLDLVPDLGGRLGEVGRHGDAPLGPRTVPDGDAAVAARLGPVLDVQVELAVIVADRVQPGLVVDPAAGGRGGV